MGRVSLRSEWILANQKFMAFHVAALLGVLGHLIQLAWSGVISWSFIGFFFGVELGSGLVIAFVTWHTVIAVHEMAHFLEAGRTQALGPEDQRRYEAEARRAERGSIAAATWRARLFLTIPYGRYWGVRKSSGGYFVPLEMGGDATLAVHAAGPLADRALSRVTLFPGLLVYGAGIALLGVTRPWGLALVYLGRLCAALGVVSFLDVARTDDGAFAKYREWRRRGGEERRGRSAVEEAEGTSFEPAARRRLLQRMDRAGMYEARSPDGAEVLRAPWQFRNTIHGGEHVRDQGGNVTLQEFMIVPVAADYVEAAAMCNAIQDRAMQLIQNAGGMKFVGVGREGGIVGTFDGYDEQALDVLVRAIEEAGYRPGGLQSNLLDEWSQVEELPGYPQAVSEEDRRFLREVAYPDGVLDAELAVEDRHRIVRLLAESGHRAGAWVAIDAAAESMADAYRRTSGTDAVGLYQYYLRSGIERQVVSSDDLLRLYRSWIERYPVISLEDPFAVDDRKAWQKLTRELGEEVLVVGDDLVVTNELFVSGVVDEGLVNAILIKPNQIGTISETLLAVEAARSRGVPVIVSHRSKSGIDAIEAELALAVGALGLKAGGAKLSERIHKYQRVADATERVRRGDRPPSVPGSVRIRSLRAVEAQTSAGPATTRVLLELDNGVSIESAVPVATSSGPEEAIQRVDGDPHRYGGEGVLGAVAAFNREVAPLFRGSRLDELGGIVEIDAKLLDLERRAARRRYRESRSGDGRPCERDDRIARGILAPDADALETTRILQRKANLGANAILPASIALMRVVAARQGLQPHEYLRGVLVGGIDRRSLYGLEPPGESREAVGTDLQGMGSTASVEGRPRSAGAAEPTTEEIRS